MSSAPSSDIELALRTPLPISSSTVYLPVSRSVSAETLTSDAVGTADMDHGALNQSSLPPVDKGFGAWSFLIAAFFVQGTVYGFPNAFGVFLDAYLSDPRYNSQPKASALLPLIGPVASGIIYCSGPFITPLITRYPYHRRTSLYIGTVLCWVSLFAASYTTQVVLLVALQGVLYAIGGALLYFPCISYLSEWFNHKRGFANGVVFAGTGAGGVILPLILPLLIAAYGPSKTLRILSVTVAILIVPLLPFLKGRLPESRARVTGPIPRGRGNRDWMKSTSFRVLLVANTFQGFGYFVPIVWLPTFAGDLNLTSSKSSLALALLNCGNVLGRLSMGYLSDKVNPWLLAFSTLASTSATTFVLWGVLSYNLAGLLSFGILYGVFAGGWSSSWHAFTRPLTANDPNLSTTLFGVLLFSRGMGNIFSTPISSALASGLNSNSTASSSIQQHDTLGFHVGGGKFEKMIVYVGTCFAGAAFISLIGWGVDIINKRSSDGDERPRTQELES